jgi:hypothetical protein
MGDSEETTEEDTPLREVSWQDAVTSLAHKSVGAAHDDLGILVSWYRLHSPT